MSIIKHDFDYRVKSSGHLSVEVFYRTSALRKGQERRHFFTTSRRDIGCVMYRYKWILWANNDCGHDHTNRRPVSVRASHNTALYLITHSVAYRVMGSTAAQLSEDDENAMWHSVSERTSPVKRANTAASRYVTVLCGRCRVLSIRLQQLCYARITLYAISNYCSAYGGER